MLVPLLFSLHCVLRMPLAACGGRRGGGKAHKMPQWIEFAPYC